MSKETKKPKKIEKVLSLEERLWETAEHLRGPLESAQYKYIALGLMFLKFISDRFEERRTELEEETKNPKSQNYCKTEQQRQFVLDDKDQYFRKSIPYLKKGVRWVDLQNAAKTQNIGIQIDKMQLQIEHDNLILAGVLPRVYGESKIPNENLQELVNLFSGIGFGTKELADRDSFGRAYEFFIKKFAKNEGNRAGEFYTPSSIVRLIVEILEPYEGKIYDPTCGSGGMFVQSMKFLDAHKEKKGKKGVAIYGQEIKDGVWRLCKMNLVLRGIDSTNVVLGDSLKNDKFSGMKFDRVMANPPFNVREWGYDQLKEDKRWKYGVPSDSKPGGNYAFMQHMIHHLDENDGKLGLVLANGSMSAGGNEGEIRKKIVEADLVDCMVALPTNLFFTVTIPACLWFIAKNKNDGESRKRIGQTLFIDARKIFTPVDRRTNEFSEEQLQRIAGTYRSYIGEKGYPKYEDISGYCKVATIEDIAKNNFVLTPGRYVGAEDVEEDDEPFEDKMKRLVKEYSELSEKSKDLDKEIRKNLKELGFEI
ncbi:MAG: N-6 DNA methylase [Thaumarchaeota archaeon]|nr:N-6 DNA methylase [Nitrososphaerota archaeon]